MRGGNILKVKLLLLVILFLFSAVLVVADSSIVVTPTKNQISVAEQAEFSLKITNNEAFTQRYSLYSLQSGQGWGVDPSPLKDKIIQINPGQSYTTKIMVNPLDDFLPGIYYVHMTIESDHGERYNEAMKIYVGNEKPMGYLPSFIVEVDMDEKINPQEPVSIKLFLENRNPLDLSNLKVKMQSEMVGFDKEVSIDLPPLQKKTVEFTVTPNPYQQPKDYLLFFVFEKEGQTVKVMEQRVEVVTMLPDFTLDSVSQSKYLKKIVKINVKNEGNVLNTQEVKVPISFIGSLLTRADTKRMGGETYAVWELTLQPSESVEVEMAINYRVLLFLLIFIVLILVFYFAVKSPVLINKKAVTTKSDDEGALSEIKVTLEVKNKSKKPLKDIQVIDLIPGIANLEKSLELGTLKPHQIKHTQKGTKVIWSLAEIEGQEHRLITYKVKAKLNILGTLSLPRAIVEFKKGKKARKAYSNVYKLG
ncbi:MAG: hypothetical protein ABIH82_05750 [Candidatus Woesearchaeota archaeon]